MNRNIFVYACENRSGKSLVSFSLVKLLRTYYPRVGFFRPVTNSDPWEDDIHINTAIKYLSLTSKSSDMKGIDAKDMNNNNESYQKIFQNYQKIQKQNDIVVCDGAILNSPEVNLEIANNLNCEIIAVVNAHEKTLSEISEDCLKYCKQLKSNGCMVLGIIINRALPIQIPALKDCLKEANIPYSIIGIIPEEDTLSKPSVADVQKILRAEIITGHEQANRIIHNNVIAAKHTSSFLAMNHSKNDSLVITPGDRQDILLSCIIADQSKLYPRIAGILLTAGIQLEPAVKQIIDGISNCPAILATNLSTFDVAAKIHNANYPSVLSTPEKLDLGCKHIIDNLETEIIKQKLNNPNVNPINKYMLQSYLLTKAQESIKHIVFPEGDDIRVLKAAEKLVRLNAAIVTILGNTETIKNIASKNNICLDNIKIISPTDHPDLLKYANHLYEKRKHKNMTINIAKDMILNRIMFATCMVDIGDADGMVSGASHTTSDTIRPALQVIKTKPGHDFACSIFVMCMANKVVLYGDCAVTINPDAKQLAHIAESAAEIATKLGIDPKIALLSYSSGASGHGSSVDKVRAASDLLLSKRPDLKLAGPIQYDAAVDPKIGIRKLPESKVAGQANVLIFPDLDTGNNTYKAVQKEANGLAIGPILIGLNKPVNDLSRGCEAEEIFMTALITIMQVE